MANECGRDVPVRKAVQGGKSGAVVAVFPLLDEGERYSELLLEIEGFFVHLGRCVLEHHLYFTRLDYGIPYHRDVPYASVLAHGNGVGYVSSVGHIPLTQVVDINNGGLVAGLFVFQDSSASEPVKQKAEVQLRRYVLRGEDVQVVRLLCHRAQQGTVIAQFCVRCLGIEVCYRLHRYAPRLVSLVEGDTLGAPALESVVVLHRRACNSQPAGIYVVTLPGIVVVAIVECGVVLKGLYFVEVRIRGPGQQSLILLFLLYRKGFQYARSGLDYAVLARLGFGLCLVDAVNLLELCRKSHLGIVCFAFLA